MDYKGARVLITGGAGFIGSNLARRLIADEAEITILDDFSTGNMENLEGVKAEVIHGSVFDKELAKFYVQSSDVVFHLAAKSISASTKNPADDFETNIGGTLNILMAMQHPCPFKLVYASSASVYGNARYLPINEDDAINLLTPYAVSKFAGEGYCMAFYESFSIPVIVLRLSNVYGPYQTPANPFCGAIGKFMHSVLHYRNIIIHGDGLSTRDFTYVSDVVEALYTAGLSKVEGEVFNVATGIETSVLTVADKILQINPDLSIDFIDRRDIDNIRRRVLNIEKIRKRLKWTPKVNLSAGLINTYNWMRDKI